MTWFPSAISFLKPPAAEATTILAAVSGDGNAAPDAQPDYPCNVRCVAAGDGGSMDLTVTITGTRSNGASDTEKITLDAGDDDYDGVKGWASISDIAYAGTWDGASVTFKNGPLLGLPDYCCVEIVKEIFDGSDQTIGTLDTANQTYEPTGVMDGAKTLELWTNPLR